MGIDVAKRLGEHEDPTVFSFWEKIQEMGNVNADAQEMFQLALASFLERSEADVNINLIHLLSLGSSAKIIAKQNGGDLRVKMLELEARVSRYSKMFLSGGDKKAEAIQQTLPLYADYLRVCKTYGCSAYFDALNKKAKDDLLLRILGGFHPSVVSGNLFFGRIYSSPEVGGKKKAAFFGLTIAIEQALLMAKVIDEGLA